MSGVSKYRSPCSIIPLYSTHHRQGMASPTNSSISILGLPASVPMAHLEVLLTTLTATPNCSVPTQPTALSSSPKEGHINHFFDKFPPPPYTAHLVVGVVMTIVGIVAVVGNLFIIYIFLRSVKSLMASMLFF